MRLVNKWLIVITIFVSWTGIVLADSNGIIINWRPFIVKDYLELNQPMKNILPKNLFAIEEKWRQFDDIEEFLHSDLLMINNSPKATAKKSMLSKIKISVSQVNSFMLPGNENISSGKDGVLSQTARMLPSLFQNPSKEMTLETLKLIEPQVNLGFEF
jgi:hypothetical protein